jgi:hypothetical protein
MAQAIRPIRLRQQAYMRLAAPKTALSTTTTAGAQDESRLPASGEQPYEEPYGGVFVEIVQKAERTIR